MSRAFAQTGFGPLVFLFFPAYNYQSMAFRGGMSSLTETNKFRAMYFIRYFGDAFFSPFLATYLVTKGLASGQLGILLAITPIITIAANPFWNFLVKDMKVSRLVLKIMTVLEGILILVLTQSNLFETLAIAVALIAFVSSPFSAIEDGFTATYTNAHHLEFSTIRIYASIAYVLGLAMGGYFVRFLGYGWLFWTASGFFLLNGLITAWVKPLDSHAGGLPAPKRNFKSLVKNREFFKFLLYYTLANGSIRVGEAYFAVYLTEGRGVDIVVYGWIFSAMIVVEALTLMAFNRHGSDRGNRQWMIVGTVLFAVRFLSYGIDLPLPVVILLTLGRGVGSGIWLFVFIRYVIQIVGIGNVTSAILGISLSIAIFNGVGNLIGEQMISAWGYPTFYLIQTVLVGIGLTVFLVFPPIIKPEDTGSSPLTPIQS